MERARFRTQRARLTVGIDEVGRGPIAGPVAVGAFAFMDVRGRTLFRGAKESKQLTEAAREAWFARIEAARDAGLVAFHVAFRSEKVIDSPARGLAFAIRSALAECLDELRIPPERCRVLLDGGLKAPAEYIDQKTIIKGDEKELAIALASICAKVLRDRRMNALARKHPAYGFDAHKGYGTRAHYAALSAHGLVPAHRRSFLGRWLGLAGAKSRTKQARR